VRTLLAIVMVLGCSRSEKKPPPPHVSSLPPLPAAPYAAVDPPTAQPTFPRDAPAIVLWQGGGQPPRTILSVRIWADGTVRYRCNRRGVLPAERVSAMLDTFENASWLPPGSKIEQRANEVEPNCITTSVQLTRGDRATRRDSSCGEPNPSLDDAVTFIQAVVGPDPCGA
jgi:hypothetical protein